jgi:hypothetical protein
VAARFTRTDDHVVCLCPEPGWLLRRLREDGRGSVDVRPGPPTCGGLATLLAGTRKLCLYDNTALTGSQRARILAEHHVAVIAPALFDDGVLRITRHGDGLRLAGELDISNRHGMVAAMAQGVTAIDVRSLRFVDAGGVEAMYSAARDRVLLRYPHPVPRRVVELLDPKAERLVCEGVGSG